MVEIRDATNGKTLLRRVEDASTLTWRSVRGLSGRRSIGLDEGMLLHDPLRCIHTFGMRCAIDIVFLDHQLEVVGVAAAVPPGRLRWCRRGAIQLELRAGRAATLAIAPGRRLELVEHAATRTRGTVVRRISTWLARIRQAVSQPSNNALWRARNRV